MAFDDEVARLVRDHHDAFLVEILGVEHCGLPQARIDELRARGILTDEDLRPRRRPDPFTVTVDYGRYLEKLASMRMGEEVVAFLRLPADEAAKKAHVPRREVEGHPRHHEPEAVVLHEDHAHLEMAHPPEPDDKHVTGSPPLIPPGRPPGGAGDDAFFESYSDAVHRIGMYCRGLGDTWTDKLQQWVGEKWQEEYLVSTPVPEARRRTLNVIQQIVLRAHEEHWPANQLAKELARETSDFGRNWQRIAETELQFLFNETMLRSTIMRWGDKARIARVPETTACTYCLRLFLDKQGLPIIFTPEELLRNGTNVGKPKAKWVAVACPLHPKCRCLLISVPPGTYVTRDGRIRSSAPVPIA